MNESQINLPSRCLPYPGVDPRSITLRPYTGGDVEAMASTPSDKPETKHAKVLERVLKGISPYDMTEGDRLFCLLWLTINTFGPIYPMMAECVTCGEMSGVDADLSQLDTIKLPEDYTEPNMTSGEPIRLPRVKDLVEAERLGTHPWIATVASCLDPKEKFEDRVKRVHDMPLQKAKDIFDFCLKHQHGPVLQWKWECGAVTEKVQTTWDQIAIGDEAEWGTKIEEEITSVLLEKLSDTQAKAVATGALVELKPDTPVVRRIKCGAHNLHRIPMSVAIFFPGLAEVG